MSSRNIILSQSEYDALVEEIHRLQAKISKLTALRDDLLYHICPALRAEYEEKIAQLERELLAAEMYLRENQRTLEILQAQINRQKEPSYEEAKAEAHKEFEEYEEELNKKAREAEDFKKSWEEESEWAEHDRKEKEEEKKRQEGNEKKNPGEGPDNTGEDTGDGSSSDDQKDGEEKKGDDSGKHIGMDDDETGGDDDWEEPKEEPENDSPIKKLKRLYRKIVKRLHPDVHPDITPREKELFNMAQEAMKRGDLEAMQRIYDELSGMDAPEDQFEDTPEGIANLKEILRKLKLRLEILQKEINHIKSEFPYTMKSFLEDEEAVKEKQDEIKNNLWNIREANKKLEAYIKQVREEYGL